MGTFFFCSVYKGGQLALAVMGDFKVMGECQTFQLHAIHSVGMLLERGLGKALCVLLRGLFPIFKAEGCDNNSYVRRTSRTNSV